MNNSAKINDQLESARKAKKEMYIAKAKYVFETMSHFLTEYPIQDLSDECLNFVDKTYEKAKEINGDY